MKINHLTVTALGILAIGLIGFTNCSKVGFEAMPERVTGSGDAVLPPPSEVIANCKTALQDGTLKNLQRQIVFEDSRVETGRAEICEFETDDNLAQKQDFLTARYTQSVELDLPEGSIICGAEIQSGTQSFEFDDMFYLTFNDFVLASSLNRSIQQLDMSPVTIENSGKMVGLYHYDWLKVRNANFTGVNSQSDDYCLGEAEGHASCSWPLSQQQGQISLQFDPELLINIGLRAGDEPQRFGFVVTGDNDPLKDCYHEKLTFDTKIYYYQK